MSKARDLADFVSAGSPLADGTISVSEVSGAAPTASPTFTGSVESEGNVRINTSSNPVLRFAESGTLRSLLTSSSTIGLSVEAQSTLPFVVQTNGA